MANSGEKIHTDVRCEGLWRDLLKIYSLVKWDLLCIWGNQESRRRELRYQGQTRLHSLLIIFWVFQDFNYSVHTWRQQICHYFTDCTNLVIETKNFWTFCLSCRNTKGWFRRNTMVQLSDSRRGEPQWRKELQLTNKKGCWLCIIFQHLFHLGRPISLFARHLCRLSF